MVDRPILMSAPMVRATLREIRRPGTGKTQTRRVVKPQPEGRISPLVSFNHGRMEIAFGPDMKAKGGGPRWWRPLAQAGDRLWVRETWAVSTVYDGMKPRDINPDGKPDWCGIRYEATDERLGIKDRVSIHMPRWASRLTLYVKDVRVERLQDISEADAWAEGCMRGLRDDVGGFFPAEEPDPSGIGQRGWDCARDWYADLWDSINGPDAWDANPWVFAYTFVPYPENIDNLPTTLPVTA